MALSKIVAESVASNAVTTAALSDSGVTAGSYGNTTAIPVITVDAKGRITSATTNSVSGVTGVSFTSANNTVIVSTSTTDFSANINASLNTTYSNATSYADTAAATAYSNAVSTASTDASTKAGTAYSNATSYADTKAATAYSNATSYADTAAATAYTNAVAYAASNSYVNSTFAPLAGATFTGGVTVSNTIATGNSTITGFANVTGSLTVGGVATITGNLVVNGTTITVNTSQINTTDSLMYLASNNEVSDSIDIGIAGHYNNGAGANGHTGFIRSAVTKKWYLFQNYQPEFFANNTVDIANTATGIQMADLVVGNLVANSTLTVTGAATFSNTIAVTGTSTFTGLITGTITSANNADYLDGQHGSYYSGLSDTAYSNAITYAAANSYVNTQLGLKANLSGATFTGAVTVSNTMSVGNTVINGTGYLQVPVGNTSNRPVSASNGMIRYNTQTGYFETYTAAGWGSVATPPNITTVSPSTYNGESGTSFTINGSFFDSGATVKFITNGGTEYTAATVSYVNSGQLTATTPQDFTVANEPLSVKVINSSGLSYTISSVIDCGGSPTWTTASGSLGTVLERNSFANTVAATDPDAGATVSYSVATGSLPSGISLTSGNGYISGTAPDIANDTTYNFDLAATDNAGNQTTRAFSILVQADLYALTSNNVTFSEGTTMGRFGTDQATWISRVAQAWASNTSNFAVTSGIVYWTVPRTGTYRILASGASGAYNPGASVQAVSKGAIMRGNLALTRGDILQILVGKRGDTVDNGSAYYSIGAGGGGSFVAYSNNTPIVVAGGGGGTFNGASTLADSYYFGQTRNVPLLNFSHDTVTSGYGGEGFDAGGGGGYYGDGFQSSYGGGSTTNATGYSSPSGTQGRAFLNGSGYRGYGGTNSTGSTYGPDAEGGFGGGGGGHTGANAAGGGGGYTGGAGGYSGYSSGTVHGFGGGSYLHPSMTSAGTSDAQYNGSGTHNGYAITNLGFNTANYAGYVIIDLIG